MGNSNVYKQKKWLAILLAMAVAVTYCIPTWAFAENKNAQTEEEWIEGFETSIVNSGKADFSYFDKDGKETDENNAVVKVKKTIEQKDKKKNEFDVKLEVQTKKGVQTLTENVDSQLVVVMDKSYLMRYGDGSEQKIEKAKAALKDFLDNHYVKNAADGHRWISIVGMGSRGEKLVDWTDANANGKVSSNIINAIDGIKLEKEPQIAPSTIYEGEGANFESSMYLARNLLKNPSSGMKKSLNPQVGSSVVFLTAGRPTLCTYDYDVVGNWDAKNGQKWDEDYRNYGKIYTDSTNYVGTSGKRVSWTGWWDIDEIGPCADEIHGIGKNGTKIYAIVYANKDEYFDAYRKAGIQVYRTYNMIDFLTKNRNTAIREDSKGIYYGGMDAAYTSTEDLSDLKRAFSNVSNEITKDIEANAFKITDHIGSPYVELIEKSLGENVKVNAEKNEIDWILKADKIENWTKYTTSYKIRLRTDKIGFTRNESYKIAGNEKLSVEYTYDETGAKPQRHAPKFADDIAISGNVAKCAYSIKHMVRDEKTGDYKLYDSSGVSDGIEKIKEPVEIRSSVNPLESDVAKDILKDYDCDTYNSSATPQVTIDENNKVIEVKYTKKHYNVKVNYVLDITTKNEGAADTSERFEGASPENFDVISGTNLKNGGNLKYGEKEYAPREEKSRFSSKVSSVCEFVKLEEKESKSLSNVKSDVEVTAYYKCTVDKRYKTDVKLILVYREGKWILDDATQRYKHIFDDTQDAEHTQVQQSTGHVNGDTASLKVEHSSIYTELIEQNNVSKYENGFAEVEAKADENGTLTIAKLILGKPLDKNDSNIPGGSVEISVTHKYVTKGKKIENGQAVDFETDDGEYTTNPEKYWKNEVFKLEAKPKDTNYKMDLNASGVNTTYEKYKEYTVQGNEGTNGKLNIEITYTKLVMPEAATLKVNHKLVKYKKIADENGNITEVEISNTDDVETSEEMSGKFKGEIVPISKANTNYALIEEKSKNSNENLNIKSDGTVEITLNADLNEVTLYYKDSNVVEGRDKAHKNVYHQYKNKIVVLKENQPDIEERIKTTDAEKLGEYVGDTVTISTIETCGINEDLFMGKEFKFVGYKEGNAQDITPSTKDEFEAKKFTILKENADITLVYERDQKDTSLKTATFIVTHNFFKNIWKAVENAGQFVATWVRPDSPTETETTKSDENTTYYVGQKVKLDSLSKEGYTLDGAERIEELKKTSANGNLNEFTYNYDSKIDSEKPKTIAITVEHKYDLKKIAEDGKVTEDKSLDTTLNDVYNRYFEETQETNFKLPTNYADIKVEAKANIDGIVPEGYDGKTPIIITVPEDKDGKGVVLTYTYTATEDKSVPAKLVIKEYYTEIYADGRDSVTTLKSEREENGYKTNKITTKLSENDIYAVDKIESTSGEYNRNGEYVEFTLASGDNTLDIYYKNRPGKENQEGLTKYTIIRNYYKKDTSGITPVPEGQIGNVVEKGVTESSKELQGYESNPVKIDEPLKNGYKNYKDVEYKFDSIVKPAGAGELKLDKMDNAANNVIELNYLYEYDASKNVKFIIKHVYKTGERVDSEKTEIAEYGNDAYGTWNDEAKTFTAKTFPEGRYTNITTDSKVYTNVKYQEGENTITIEYQWRSKKKPDNTGNTGNGNNSGDNNGGTNSGNDNGNGTNSGDTSGTTPSTNPGAGTDNGGTTNIADGSVPLTNEPIATIEEEKVPLAAAPTVKVNTAANKAGSAKSVGMATTDIADGDVPLAAAPKGGIKIDDENVPLAMNPENNVLVSGNSGKFGMSKLMGMGLIGAGLGLLLLFFLFLFFKRRKKDEEEENQA